MVNILLTTLSLFLSIFISGCGGGGSGVNASPTTTTASVTISGTGGKGLMGGATVSAFLVNQDGTISTTPLDTTTSGNSPTNFGSYSLNIPSSPQPIVVQMTANSNTTMLDETNITNGVQNIVNAPIGMTLRSFVSSGNANNTSVSINPFTEMAIASLPSSGYSASSLQAAAYVIKTTILGGAVDPFSTLIPASTAAPSVTDSSISQAQLALFSVNSQVANLAKTGPCGTQATPGAMFQCVVSDPKNGLNATISVDPSTSKANINSSTTLSALQKTPLPPAVQIAVGANAVSLPASLANSVGSTPSSSSNSSSSGTSSSGTSSSGTSSSGTSSSGTSSSSTSSSSTSGSSTSSSGTSSSGTSGSGTSSSGTSSSSTSSSGTSSSGTSSSGTSSSGSGSTATSTSSSGSIAIPSPSALDSITSANTFAKNLSSTAQSYSGFISSFGTAGKNLVQLSDINLRMFTFLINSINDLCGRPTCVVGRSVPYTKTYPGGFSYNFNNDPIGAGYSVSLSQGSNSSTYNYTISNNSSSYTGTFSFTNNTSTGWTIAFTGNVPNLVQIIRGGPTLVQSTSVQFTLTASTLSPTVNSPISGTISFSASAAATSSLPAYSFTISNGTARGQILTGSPSYTLASTCSNSSQGNQTTLICTPGATVYKAYDAAPTSISGSICLSQGDTSCLSPGSTSSANTFIGQFNATAAYSQPAITPTASAPATTTNVVYPETASLSGTVTLSNGDTATGSISLTSDYSKVTQTSVQSSSNYALGGFNIDLAGYNATKTSFTEIVLIDQRTSYTNANISAQAFFSSDKANWIKLATSYTIDTGSCGVYDWLCFTPIKSNTVNDSIAITSSGAFSGTYSIKGQSATITDANSNTVGLIKNNQLYIDGGVTLLSFQATK